MSSIHQKDITILNVYVSYHKAWKYLKQKFTVLKRKTEKSTTIEGDLKTPFSVTDRRDTAPPQKKISKEIEELNNELNLPDKIL